MISAVRSVRSSSTKCWIMTQGKGLKVSGNDNKASSTTENCGGSNMQPAARSCNVIGPRGGPYQSEEMGEEGGKGGRRKGFSRLSILVVTRSKMAIDRRP